MEGAEFWTKVKKRLKELDKKQDWLASNSGLLVQTLRNNIHNDRLPSLKDTLSILKTLNLTWEEFEHYPNLTSKDGIRNIPVSEQYFSAGHGQYVPDDYVETKDYVAVPNSLKYLGENIRAAYVRGDSMEPTFFNEDIIIYDTNGYDGNEGIYAIIYNGKGFVKRLQPTKNGVNIISDNMIYEPMFESSESDDFIVIGRVRYSVHKI